MKNQEKLDLFEVGRRVRQVREEKHLSGEELGARIHRSQNAISKIELGQTAKVNLDNIRLIAKECDTTEDYLLLRSNYKTREEEIRALIGQMQNDDTMWLAFIKYIALFAGYTMKDKSSMDITPSPYMVFERDGQEEHFSLEDVNDFIREVTKHSGLSFQMMIDRKKGE